MLLLVALLLVSTFAAHSTVPASRSRVRPGTTVTFSVVIDRKIDLATLDKVVYQTTTSEDPWPRITLGTVTTNNAAMTTTFSGSVVVPKLPGVYDLVFKVVHKNAPASADYFLTISSLDVTCSDGIGCNGMERWVEGRCVNAVRPLCDDLDACTVDSCVEPGICSRSRNTALPDSKCPNCTGAGCKADCRGKVCGGDGCGGSCGLCGVAADGTPLNCVNGACSSQQFPGTCTTSEDLTARAAAIGFAGQVIVSGDNSAGLNQITPFCNQQSTAAEQVWKLKNTMGTFVGIDVRMVSTSGDVNALDSVIQLIEVNPALYPNTDLGCLSANGNSQMMVACSDDSSPPGGLSSRVTYSMKVGYTYYIVADGYASQTVGPYTLTITLTPACTLKCDGKYCGASGCTTTNGTCGVCGAGLTCGSAGKCVPSPCIPDCSNGASCGDDGCGGTCGVCKDGWACVTDIRKCRHVEPCNHFQPLCRSGINGNFGCPSQQYCGSDCACHKLSDPLMDLVIRTQDILPQIVDHYEITQDSCALAEGCVSAPGFRKIVKFATNVLNQGTAAFAPPAPPAAHPELFVWGACHGHWHFQGFAYFMLTDLAGNTLVTGRKQSYCAEDSYRMVAPGTQFSGTNVACDAQTSCDVQGLSVGWVDVYGSDLDCQFLDITGIAPGNYKIRMCTNVGRNFEELSFDNNCGEVPFTIPA